MKRLLFILLALSVLSVMNSAAYSWEDKLIDKPYEIGPLKVFIRPQPEVEFLCRLRLPALRHDQRVMGCYLPDTQTIISVNDAEAVIHEIKHFFEGRFHD